MNSLEGEGSTGYWFHEGLQHGLVSLVNRILYQEIDYLNEGRNADRFRRDFRKQKWVKVPVSFFSSHKLMTSRGVHVT